MVALKIHHTTTYRYGQHLRLGLHRLMLRPRESRHLRLVACDVNVSPIAAVTWAHDVFGNAVATASFDATTDQVVIYSSAVPHLDAAAWPVFAIAATAVSYPFRYSDDGWTDLGALARQQDPDPAGQLITWARGLIRGKPTDTLSLLKNISIGVAETVRYQSRDDMGTQSPS